MTQPSQPKPASKFATFAMLAFFAGVGFLAFNSCQSNARYEAQQTAKADADNQKRMKANIATFEKKLSHGELVAYVEPFLDEHPNAANIRLEKTWNDASIADQHAVLGIWAGEWFDTVKANPAGEDEPRLWVHGPDGSLVESLSRK